LSSEVTQVAAEVISDEKYNIDVLNIKAENAANIRAQVKQPDVNSLQVLNNERSTATKHGSPLVDDADSVSFKRLRS
jgi:hypothetical protein